jgi:hypothetical protein
MKNLAMRARVCVRALYKKRFHFNTSPGVLKTVRRALLRVTGVGAACAAATVTCQAVTCAVESALTRHSAAHDARHSSSDSRRDRYLARLQRLHTGRPHCAHGGVVSRRRRRRERRPVGRLACAVAAHTALKRSAAGDWCCSCANTHSVSLPQVAHSARTLLPCAQSRRARIAHRRVVHGAACAQWLLLVSVLHCRCECVCLCARVTRVRTRTLRVSHCRQVRVGCSQRHRR